MSIGTDPSAAIAVDNEPSGSGRDADWLKTLLSWQKSGQYLKVVDFDRWLALSTDAPLAEASIPHFELLRLVGHRPKTWHWLGIALLTAPSTMGKLGNAGRRLGMKGLRQLLEDESSSAINQTIRSIDAQLISGGSPERIDLSADTDEIKSWQADALRFALALLGRALTTGTDAPASPPTLTKTSSSSGGKRRPAVTDSIFLAGRRHLPDLPLADLRELPAVSEVPASGEDQPGWTGKDFGDSLVYEHWLAEHTADLHLAGALIPGNDRAFTRGEAVVIAERLEQVMATSDSDSSLNICALAYSIALVTGQPRQSVVGAMAHLAAGRKETSAAGWLEPNRFHVSLPMADVFGKVASSESGVYRPCQEAFWLPLPELLTRSLESLSDLDPVLWKGSAAAWDLHFGRLKSYLAPVTPRFSEARLRHVLPVATWLRTADIVKTQLISGQLLDHPGAALHYFAVSPQVLNDTYRESMKPWLPAGWRFPEGTETTEKDRELVGAPRAAVEDSAIREAIAALVRRCEVNLGRLSGDLPNLIGAYNTVVALTVALFAAATANRLTYHLGLLTRRDFVLPDRASRSLVGNFAEGNGLVVFTDKHTDNGLSFRVTALPALVIEQVSVLLDFTAHLQRCVANIPGCREARDALGRILSGERALFQRIVVDPSVGRPTKVRLVRFKRRDMATAWPELPFPIEHLRHRFTSVAAGCGIAPGDLRLQMGHSMDYLPFGAADPDSPRDFVMRVAPRLEIGLRTEGWKVVGGSLLPRVPDLVPLNTAQVLSLESLYVKRLDHRWKRYRQVIARETPQFREAILGLMGSLEDEEDVPAKPLNLSNRDLRNVEEQLKKRYEETGRWPAVSKAFRVWVRQEVAAGRLGVPVPRTTFYKHVEVPAITPVLPRAYQSARALLLQAEKLVTAPPQVKGAEAAIPEGALALAIAEFSVRAGLTQSTRLLDAIRSLESVAPYGDRLDQVLITLGKRMREDSVSADDAEQDHATTEGFLLTGASAMLALAWKSRFGHASAEVTDGAMRAAVSKLKVTDPVGRGRDLTSTLENVLRTAVLSRRLTVSGVRSAWEEGRLGARSFSPDREQVLREGAWVAPALAAKPVSQKWLPDSRGKQTLSGDEAFLRWMRKELHLSRTRRKKLTHDQIAERLQAELRASPDCAGTAAVFVRLVVGWLRGNQLAWRRRTSTVYTYLTLLVTPILTALQGRDLLQIDADELEEIVLPLFLAKRVGNQARMHAVLQHLLTVVAELGGPQLEENPFVEWEFSQPYKHATPCCLSVAEQQYAMMQLQFWREIGASDRARGSESGYRARDVSVAMYLLGCARMGLRVGESASRRRDDLIRIGDSSVLLVRPRRKFPLKTLSSHRALILEDHLAGVDLETVIRTLYTLEERESVLPTSDAKAVASAALATVSPSGTARLHAGRHALACAGFQAIVEREVDGQTPRYEGLSRPRWLTPFRHHPPAIQLLVLARTLGHATPITTLNHYIHLLGYTSGNDRGWPTPDGKDLAALALTSYGALRTRLSRAGKAAADITLADLIRVLRLNVKPGSSVCADEFSPFGVPPAKVLTTQKTGYQQIGRMLLDLAKGASPVQMLATHGLSAERLSYIADEILVLQEHYRYRLLGSDLKVKRRIPRWTLVERFLANCDTAANDPEQWAHFIAMLQRQTRLDVQLRVPLGSSVEAVQATVGKIFNSEVTTIERGDSDFVQPSILFDHGLAKGRSTAPVVFTYFVLLLAIRLDLQKT